jgi:hypothetical protein
VSVVSAPARRRRADPPAARAAVGGATAAVVLLAIGLRLLYGPGAVGYDAAWALDWGRELAHGSVSALDAPGAPSPHPLAIAVSALLSPLGGAALPAAMALAWLSYAALGLLAFALGRTLYSAWVGALFAAVLLTRPLLALETGQAVIDVPFLALVLAALLLEARGGRGVPVLLLAAGLLRPEAWLLGLAYLAWSLPRRPADERVRTAAIVLAAPVAWALFDLIATGDPLHSLHGTQALAEQLQRPRTLATAVDAEPEYLRSVLSTQVVWLGLAGAAAALVWLYERTVLTAAAAALGLVAFLVLGATGLPLLTRYLLLPATLLALWCAVAALGFTVVRSRAWLLAGGAALVVLALAVPDQRGALRRSLSALHTRSRISSQLVDIASDPRVRAAAARCGAVSVPDDRPRPLAAYALSRRPSTVAVGARDRGVMLSYASEPARRAYRIGGATPAGAPAGSRPLAANGSWIASARGC